MGFVKMYFFVSPWEGRFLIPIIPALLTAPLLDLIYAGSSEVFYGGGYG
jgi:hypothetical protein